MRRHHVKTSLFLLVICIFFWMGFRTLSADTELDPYKPPINANKPNIVFILADDLDISSSEYWERADQLMGTPASNCDQSRVTAEMTCDPLRKTRALVKDQGITFENAFVSTSLCCSSRASMETGKYAHNTGVITNGGDIGGYSAFVKYGNLDNTIAVGLQSKGYRTAIVGKYLNGIEEVTNIHDYPPGWSDMYIFRGGNFYDGYNYNLFERSKGQICNTVEECVHEYYQSREDYSTDVIARKAASFIDTAAETKEPFYLYVTPTAPHMPLPPAVRHENHPYRNAKITTDFWPNFQEKDISDKPRWLQDSQYIRQETINVFNDGDYQYRQGSLYALDDLVEKLVNKLKEHNLLENTYIIFAGDNGYNLGAHYLIHKMSPYEESIRIPMIMRGPGVPVKAINSNLVLALDLPVTFAQIGGLSVSDSKSSIQYDGLSLMSLFQTAYANNWRTDFMNEYMVGAVANGIGAEAPPAFWWLLGQDVPSYRAVRSEKFSFANWYQGQDLVTWDANKKQLVWNLTQKIPIAQELYNLEKDPFQMDNLLAKESGKIACKELINAFSIRLEELSACKGESCRAPFVYPQKALTQCMQIAPGGEPSAPN